MKFAPLTAIFLTIVFAMTVASIHTRLQTRSALAAAPHVDIDDQIVRYACFHHAFQSTIELLARGEMRLAEACERVHESAALHHPNYLRNIEYSDPAPTVRERIARNLVGHLQSLEEDDHALSVRVRALEVELAVLH